MKIDHSSFAWKVTKNRMVLREPGRPYEKHNDKDGLTKEQRRRIEEIKEQKTYETEDLQDL